MLGRRCGSWELRFGVIVWWVVQVDVQMEPGVDDVKKTLSGGVQLTKHAAGKSLSDKRIVFYHESSGKGYLAWQLVLHRAKAGRQRGGQR